MRRMNILFVIIFYSTALFSSEPVVTVPCAEDQQVEKPQALFKTRQYPSTEEVARSIFKKAGYVLGNESLIRHGSKHTAGGYFQVLINRNGMLMRAVAYGPGEYGIPHYHKEEEWFRVAYGECDSYEFGRIIFPGGGKPFEIILHEKPIHKRCKVGEIMTVPPYIIHCLVADDSQGLCREVLYEKSPNSFSTGFANIIIPSQIDSEEPLINRST